MTAAEHAEAVARDAAAQIRSMFEAMAEGLVLQVPGGKIIDANPAAETILGLSRDQLLGKSSLDPNWGSIREDGAPFPGHEHPAMVTLQTGQPVRNRIMGVQDPKTGLRWLSINAQPVFPAGSSTLNAVVTTFVDITDQRRLAEDLRNTHGRLRELAQRLDKVRELERGSIAQLLHEGIAQDLFAVKLGLDHLKAQFKGQIGVTETFYELTTAMEKCLGDIRQIANDLRPSALAHLRVAEAIKEHARYFSTLSQLRITVTEIDPFPALDEPTRLHLFRAAQEALTNVLRHAHASRVEIVLRTDDRWVVMEVTDDGVGIDAQALSKTGSLGILEIRERGDTFGGSLSTRKNGTAGTILSISVPLPNNRTSKTRLPRKRRT